MAKTKDIHALTPYQQKFIAWQLERRRSACEDDKFTGVLAEAKVDLNPHQVDAALFAFKSPLSMGAILADEVGLGKTIEAALVISQHWAERKRHILVIAPATLRKQWSMELEEKFYLPSLILECKNFNQLLEDTYSNPFDTTDKIIICSYQFAKKQINHIKRVDWDLVVIDEAHKLRNVYKGNNKTAIALKEGLKPFRKLLLTATPLQNNVRELYGLISIIDDGYFGSLKSFGDRYGKTELRQESIYNELRDRISPVVHRTLRHDVQEYVKYTERRAMVQEYMPSDDEIALGDLVTEYLQRDNCFGMPPSQRSLITLVLHKLLSSSTFAIAGTLQTIIDRLQNIVKDNTADKEDDELLISDLSNDIEEFAELEEEWLDEDDEDFNEEKERRSYSEDDIAEMRQEIEDLKVIHSLALGIAENTKGECLLKALEIAFEDKRRHGLAEKALIFTESNRTQQYLKQLLEQNGYAGQIVLFNGSNSDTTSKAIYQAWKERHADTSRITGSTTADKRQALVDYFREEAKIMIATEAASEGINLQFCSLLVNFDLPWNPQRIEQRIGRCHRYGQKNDVVVVNFINKNNRADQRVYELLDQKYSLFKGVFGSSDEVLGSTIDGIDFEHRVLDIYQTCRTAEEIDAAFNRLQEEMQQQIDAIMVETRSLLIENFDRDVVNKLKLRKLSDEQAVDIFSRLLNMLVCSVLGKKVKPEISRISHPIAQQAIATAKQADTSQPACITFDYAASKEKLSVIESQKGRSGLLRASVLHYHSPKEDEDRIIAVAIDDKGNPMPDDFTEKLMSLSGALDRAVNSTASVSLDSFFAQKCKESDELVSARDRRFIDEESAKIERWAEDQTFSIEQDLRDTKRQIKERERDFRKETDDTRRRTLQAEILNLQKQQRRQRQEMFQLEDEIIEQRDKLIKDIDSSLGKQTTEEPLFTIKWQIK